MTRDTDSISRPCSTGMTGCTRRLVSTPGSSTNRSAANASLLESVYETLDRAGRPARCRMRRVPDEPGTTPTGPTPVEPGEWGRRAGLIEANSELALAELNGKLYLLGGYPATRQTVRTVQIYDIASDSWQLGPPLPQPNNHGMAAGVNGKIYLIGGQTTADRPRRYVDTVYELDPATGAWVAKARMPTARSGGVAVVHDGKIYVAGGRPPRGNDFAVYDPAADQLGGAAGSTHPAQPHYRRGDQRPHPLRRRASRQRFVAPDDDSARSLRPTNADLDDRSPHAARPQRHERGHGPGLLPRLGRRGAGRHDPRP